MRYLLDTNIISALVRQQTGALSFNLAEKGEQAITSIIVAAELAFGLRKRPSRDRAARVQRVLLRFPPEPWQAPADLHYADIRTALEQAGTPIGGNDMLIAAHAIALDCTLVTDNEREFSRVPGLRVENWLRG